MIEICGEYTKDDYLLANRTTLKKTNAFLIPMIAWVSLTIIMILGILRTPFDLIHWMFFIICLVYLNYSSTILPIMVNKYFKEQKQIHGKVTINFDSDKILSRSPVDEHILKWLHHITITEKMILLYNTPKTFIMVPRGWFGNTEQYEATVLLLKNFPAG